MTATRIPGQINRRPRLKATIPRFCGKCRTIGLFATAEQRCCSECLASVARRWYAEHRAHALARMKAYRERTPRVPVNKTKRFVIEGRVHCPGCREMVPVENYYYCEYVPCRVSSYCKPCLRRKGMQVRELKRKAKFDKLR